MSEQSIMSPPSASARPAMLWPPPFMDTAMPVSRAKLTHATMSAVPIHRAISAGRRSIIAFHSARDSW
jgi:hypothetical protein